jgi:hypothetical protein
VLEQIHCQVFIDRTGTWHPLVWMFHREMGSAMFCLSDVLFYPSVIALF